MLMRKNKKDVLLLLWTLVLLMTCLMLASERQRRMMNRRCFSLELQAAGKFDRKVYAKDPIDPGGGVYGDRVVGIRLLGDTTVYPVCNRISFSRGDSVYLVSEVALPKRPLKQQTVRDALLPDQNSVRWGKIICLLLWLCVVWKTWDSFYD